MPDIFATTASHLVVLKCVRVRGHASMKLKKCAASQPS